MTTMNTRNGTESGRTLKPVSPVLAPLLRGVCPEDGGGGEVTCSKHTHTWVLVTRKHRALMYTYNRHAAGSLS